MRNAIVTYGLLWLVLAAPGEAAEGKTYYVNIGTIVCPKTFSISSKSDETPEGREKWSGKGCTILPENTAVVWDGKMTKASDAVIAVDGKQLVIPAARLQIHKKQDIYNVNFVASSISLLCLSPINLTEAASALGDQKWLKSINCVKVPVGTPAIKIRPFTPSLSEPWQVRIKLPDGEGVTLWGMPFAFTLPDGEQIRD